MIYSIVVPAHNEARTIVEFVTGFIRKLPASVSDVLDEVIIVENGSTDDTLVACGRLQESFPDLVRLFSIDRSSYGEAIKRGILECRGSHLSILECDFLDGRFVEDSISLFKAGNAEFIVASKRHPESVDGRPFKRRLFTWGFNRILNIFVGYPGSDTHGLKSIEAQLAKKLCELSVTTDEIFQTEIVLIAWRLGHRIKELPINIEERRMTPVSIRRRLPKILKMISELRKSIKRFPLGRESSRLGLSAKRTTL